MNSDDSAALDSICGNTTGGGVDAMTLNASCFCITTDVDGLQARLQKTLHDTPAAQPITQSHPHLFSPVAVFVSREHLAAMREVINAIEHVATLPGYRAAAFADAPAIARHPVATGSVFHGYDFHLGEDGPQLIEINTNAGGALLNAELCRAQAACCQMVEDRMTRPVDAATVEAAVIAMFRVEWQRARGDTPLRRIAIVDATPSEQYLYPEFLLFQRLFESIGIATVIADPTELHWRDGRLWHADAPVDLVYNRLTDFYFQAPECKALRDAYLADGVVITPHSQAHALFANKRNMARLTDATLLRTWGVNESTIATLLGGIPHTEVVRASDGDALWERRKALFFKPATGFGSRGSYRGDKVTRRVFADILAGDYVAQALVPPSTRRLNLDDHAELKLDLRNYTYDGEVQLVAARLYQGQTTNFRTPGGGFAAVLHPFE